LVGLGELVAWGAERDVYRHPLLAGRVVKLISHSTAADRNAIECEFYRQAGGSCSDLLPECYGWVETSHGRGLQYEFIADEEGNASPSLSKAVIRGELTGTAATEILRAFVERAGRARLLVHDQNIENILYQAHRRRLVMIDGFGPRDWSFGNRLLFRFPRQVEKSARRRLGRIARTWDEWLGNYQNRARSIVL
jgi:hypothetical protein